MYNVAQHIPSLNAGGLWLLFVHYWCYLLVMPLLFRGSSMCYTVDGARPANGTNPWQRHRPPDDGDVVYRRLSAAALASQSGTLITRAEQACPPPCGPTDPRASMMLYVFTVRCQHGRCNRV